MFDKSKALMSSLLSEGIVEIIGDNGAHYRAIISDISDDSEDSPNITLKFDNDWHQMQSFAVSRIRLPPIYELDINYTNDSNEDKNKPKCQSFSEGMEVEVLSKGSDCEENGFWIALIKMIKGFNY
jgi:hypothetical protein